jgi:hypothetical protein
MQVTFQGMVIQHNATQSINADEISMTIGDSTRDVIVKFVAHEGFNRQEILESVGSTILLKHVYVLNETSVFYDEQHSIASSYQLNPPNSEELVKLFSNEWNDQRHSINPHPNTNKLQPGHAHTNWFYCVLHAHTHISGGSLPAIPTNARADTHER